MAEKPAMNRLLGKRATALPGRRAQRRSEGLGKPRALHPRVDRPVSIRAGAA
jgi:hypothetical protein